MEEETRRRLGIALAILGFMIIMINGATVTGHYQVGWSIPSTPSIAVGIVFLIVGLMTANKKRQI